MSDEWASIKLDLFLIRGRKCEICSSEKNIQVHHKTYKNIFNENPEDLVVVCNNCHVKLHDKKRKPSKLVKKIIKNTTQTLAQKVRTKHRKKTLKSRLRAKRKLYGKT